MTEARALRPDELRSPALTTPGIDRREAFADDNVWVGTARTEPGIWSDWHRHPGHDTYAYAIEGRFRIEFDADGSGIEAGPGGFLLIPAGAPHREGNPGDVANFGVVFRIGEGPVIEPLAGPPTGR
jgi:quercetin dioxygenase-like cupin family protein